VYDMSGIFKIYVKRTKVDRSEMFTLLSLFAHFTASDAGKMLT
jgi:hypothetical protein